jgi:hypothetical protein
MYFWKPPETNLQPEIRKPSDTFCQWKSAERAAIPIRIPGPNADSTLSASLPTPRIITLPSMTVPAQPNVKLINAPDYREAYANSVQMRVNVWDFFLAFGTLQQQNETQVEIRNFQGIYLSPQQAKALLGLLQQNVSGYESAFGEIKLDPRMTPSGPVH